MHIPVISKFKDARISAVAELDTKRGQDIAHECGINRFYKDYHEMYEESELDGVFICLPHFLHYDAVKNALQHDINVFCEKPMGLNPDEAYNLVKLARKKDLKLAVGYNRRLDRPYEEAAEKVRSHMLGDVLQAHGILVNAGPYGGWIPSSNWFFNDEYGVLYDSGPHLIDMMMNILHEKIMEVSANGVKSMHGVDSMDNISGAFKTEADTLGSFNIGWRAGADYDAIQVHGTGCSLFADFLETKIRSGLYGPLDRVSDNIHSTKRIVASFIGREGGKNLPSETFFKEDRAFLDAILNHGKVSATGEEGLRVLEVLDAIKKSLDMKKTVKVENHKI